MRVKPSKLSIGEKMEAREKECFQFLNELPLTRRYVLIGGYAVSSFQFPRYSVDLDIVLPEEQLLFFQGFAKKRGFELEGEHDVEQTYHGRSVVYAKQVGVRVGLDLLVNSVFSRQTKFAYPFPDLFENSEVREIRGRGLGARARARVASREMLLALKTNSMRDQDMRDILALCFQEPSLSKVVAHLEKCPRKKIAENLERLDAYLSTLDPRSFRDIFGTSETVLKTSIANCQALLTGARASLGLDPTKTLGELRGVFQAQEKAVRQGIRELEREHRKEARSRKLGLGSAVHCQPLHMQLGSRLPTRCYSKAGFMSSSRRRDLLERVGKAIPGSNDQKNKTS